ncbi:MAG: 7-cyano-7-deazaguanine synthase QueC [Mariprofundaceae bacterium]
MTSAVVLLSGGLDSSTALAWALRRQHWRCHTLTIDYGQRHRIELEAAQRVSRFFAVQDHRIIRADLAAIGGSALTADIPVPKNESNSKIPVTYVPARNLILLSLAVALAEVIEARHVVIGANILDYSGYPDCRPEFIRAMNEATRLGTKCGVENNPIHIETPIIRMRKSDIIAMGLELGMDYSLTCSCYDPADNGMACGHCDSCRFRRQAFSDLGKTDPLPYPAD